MRSAVLGGSEAQELDAGGQESYERKNQGLSTANTLLFKTRADTFALQGIVPSYRMVTVL